MSPYWIADELDEFPTRPQDQFQISEDTKRRYLEELLPYWSGRSLIDWYRAHLDEDVAAAEADQVFAVAQTDKGQGHITATSRSSSRGAMAPSSIAPASAPRQIPATPSSRPR